MSIRKRRWPVALEGIIANLLLGALLTWSVFRQPLLKLFPAWTEGMLSVVFSFHNVSTCLGIWFGGWISRRYSRRKLFFVFGLMLLVGLGGIALLPVSMPGLSFVLLLLLYTVIAAFGIGFGINLVQSATLAWFPDHTGLMSGGLYMALGFSSFLLAALSRITLPLLGVKLAFAGIGLLIFIVALLILADPKALTLPAESQSSAAKPDKGVPPKIMLRSLPFWLLIIWNGSLRAIGFILLDHAASISVAFASTALVGMLISPANAFGSLSLGGLTDRLGLRKNMLVVSMLAVASALCLIFGGIYKITVAIILGLIFGGMAYGGSSSTYAASTRLIFGEKYFSANFGYTNFSLVLGALISTFSGKILDMFGGNYNSIFVMVIILLVPTLFCALTFYKTNPQPMTEEDTGPCETLKSEAIE
ncbi:MAG TPA: OFA family MFS transporter [Clostridiales bacterium]|nr:OFA family MFS transporter [Clostridiales bacterium]